MTPDERARLAGLPDTPTVTTRDITKLMPLHNGKPLGRGPAANRIKAKGLKPVEGSPSNKPEYSRAEVVAAFCAADENEQGRVVFVDRESPKVDEDTRPFPRHAGETEAERFFRLYGCTQDEHIRKFAHLDEVPYRFD